LNTSVSNMPISEETYNAIFEEVAQGNSLRSCLTKYQIAAGSFYLGLDNNKQRSERYARARNLQGEAAFDKLYNVAQSVLDGTLEPDKARVAADILKWSCARLHPKVYADKPLLDIGDNSPTEITVRWASKPKELKEVSESTEPMELPE